MRQPQIIDSEMDTQFEVLAHPTRRRLLLALYRGSAVGEATVSLADDLDAEMAVGLHHAHLPKLRDAGYVRYDEAEKEIEPGPNFSSLAWLLDALDAESDRPRLG